MPLESYGCSICGRQAPKELRQHNNFEGRMRWLRHHYEKNHPSKFRQWTKKSTTKRRK